MKRKDKALLLSAVCSLALLTGCGSQTKTVETEDGIYIEQNGEYVKVNVENQIFEPGDHHIAYVREATSSYNFDEGWDNIYSYLPDIPDGYKLNGFTTASEYKGYTDVIIFSFVNTQTVEAEGVYNSKLNIVEYTTPGKVIKEKTLELGD